MATIVGGPRLAEFLADNIGGPSLTTIGIERAKKHHMELGLHQPTFLWLAGFYRGVLTKLGIPLGSVLFQLALDETVIMPLLNVSPCGGFLLGSCGLKSTDDAPHACAPVKIPIGYGEQGYRDVCEALEKYVVAHCTCLPACCYGLMLKWCLNGLRPLCVRSTPLDHPLPCPGTFCCAQTTPPACRFTTPTRLGTR